MSWSLIWTLLGCEWSLWPSRVREKELQGHCPALLLGALGGLGLRVIDLPHPALGSWGGGKVYVHMPCCTVLSCPAPLHGILHIPDFLQIITVTLVIRNIQQEMRTNFIFSENSKRMWKMDLHFLTIFLFLQHILINAWDQAKAIKC